MPAARAAWYAAQCGGNLSAGLDAIAQAAVTGQWRQVLAGATSFTRAPASLRETAVADALCAGADWRALGQVLCLHPQAAFDQYAANLREDTRAPVQQRPHLAVLLTAGLVHRVQRRWSQNAQTFTRSVPLDGSR